MDQFRYDLIVEDGRTTVCGTENYFAKEIRKAECVFFLKFCASHQHPSRTSTTIQRSCPFYAFCAQLRNGPCSISHPKTFSTNNKCGHEILLIYKKKKSSRAMRGTNGMLGPSTLPWTGSHFWEAQITTNSTQENHIHMSVLRRSPEHVWHVRTVGIVRVGRERKDIEAEENRRFVPIIFSDSSNLLVGI